MKKLQLSLLLMVFLVMAGCSQSETTSAEEKKLKETNENLIEDYNKLVDEKESLERQMTFYEKTDENSNHLTTIVDGYLHVIRNVGFRSGEEGWTFNIVEEDGEFRISDIQHDM
ncbi:hypothetical protein [Niallia sp. FSL R7-0271]|uniref:hypothetical protein n=1 Tax=Niallia sp. FSL R7-0271 TaxID=2921678 RepID=UPI0030F7E065